MAAVPASTVTTKSVGDWTAKLKDKLWRKLGCPADAEDLAQEACVRFLQVHRANKPIRNPRAYLFRIGQHLLYRHHKTRLQWQAISALDSDELIDEATMIELEVAEALRRGQVNAAVAELPPKCRQALYLRWREGYLVDENAREMQLSRAMVKKYLARGLAHCRKRLAARHPAQARREPQYRDG